MKYASKLVQKYGSIIKKQWVSSKDKIDGSVISSVLSMWDCHRGEEVDHNPIDKINSLKKLINFCLKTKAMKMESFFSKNILKNILNSMLKNILLLLTMIASLYKLSLVLLMAGNPSSGEIVENNKNHQKAYKIELRG